jgi:hypothetical protein
MLLHSQFYGLGRDFKRLTGKKLSVLYRRRRIASYSYNNIYFFYA